METSIDSTITTSVVRPENIIRNRLQQNRIDSKVFYNTLYTDVRNAEGQDADSSELNPISSPDTPSEYFTAFGVPSIGFKSQEPSSLILSTPYKSSTISSKKCSSSSNANSSYYSSTIAKTPPERTDSYDSNDGSSTQTTSKTLRRSSSHSSLSEKYTIAKIASNGDSSISLPSTPTYKTPIRSRCTEDQLLQWKDMPKYLQFNPYVLNGYRPLQNFKGCLSSLFYWHNETVNILTHGK